jgi:hypothetical protein
MPAVICAAVRNTRDSSDAGLVRNTSDSRKPTHVLASASMFARNGAV